MKWEYKTLKLGASGFWGGKVDENEMEQYMNQLGQQGWELVTAVDTNKAYGETRDIFVIFKRIL